MHLVAVSLAAVATLFLTACGGGQGSTPAVTATAVTGQLVSDQPATLSGEAIAMLTLFDITGGPGQHRRINETTQPLAAVPGSFRLPINPKQIDSQRAYGIAVTVLDRGTVRYVTAQPVPVLTRGQPAELDVPLVAALREAVMDANVAFKRDYAEFEERLGGFSQITLPSRLIGPEGSQTGISGDAFTDETGVRMVRENLALANDGGRIARRFAFRDGRLWVARVTNGDTVMLGWDSSGNLVVAERNGQPDEGVKALEAELRSAANEALRVAESRRR
jgi:uncharacterized lipoprotein YbaY